MSKKQMIEERSAIIDKIEKFLKGYQDCVDFTPKVLCDIPCNECIAVGLCDLLFPQLIENILKENLREN